jgi:hypothetical protein
MSPATFVVLSGTLTFGAPLALAIRELFVLRNPRRGGGWAGPRPDPVKPDAPKPLPDCLIPKPISRVRELEDA